MKKSKPGRRQSPAGKGRTTARKSTKVRAKAAARKSAAARKPAKKAGRKPGPVARKADGAKARGLGPEAGGQSGDTEGLSRTELADSESVEELVEEGQAFEAGIVSGVENVPDADKGSIRTREVPEDDVPQEYLDRD